MEDYSLSSQNTHLKCPNAKYMKNTRYLRFMGTIEEYGIFAFRYFCCIIDHIYLHEIKKISVTFVFIKQYVSL